jgi:hypothetical protein
MSEGIDVSQQPLFVPAPPGWYACPGDPPGIARHWDSRKWLCEIRGPIRDHFDYLREMSFQGLTLDDKVLLRRLTAEVSAIEDLVLSRPTANPPLVQIAAPPPYIPPPVDPYTSVPLPAHGMAGSSMSSGNGKRFASTGRGNGSKRKIMVAVIAVIAVVGVLGLVAVRLASSGIASTFFASTPASLAVSSCVTLSYPSGGTDEQDVTWAPSECKTETGGPVSYTVISKLPGAAACDTDSQYVQTFTSKNAVASTYCLMENVTVGQCLYEDPKGFFFDVPCTDVRAGVKVALSVNQGADYQCPASTEPWQFPSANHTYCLQKP